MIVFDDGSSEGIPCLLGRLANTTICELWLAAHARRPPVFARSLLSGYREALLGSRRLCCDREVQTIVLLDELWQ